MRGGRVREGETEGGGKKKEGEERRGERKRNEGEYEIMENMHINNKQTLI